MGRMGRPVGSVNKGKKSIQDHFSTWMGNRIWAAGEKLFKQEYSKTLIPNGLHKAQLIEAKFDGRKSNVFVLQFEDGTTFEKVTPLDTVEGVATLLMDFKRLGFNAPDWKFLPQLYERLNIRKPEIEIEGISSGGIQYIHICTSVKQNSDLLVEPPVATTPAPAPVIVEVVQPEIVPEFIPESPIIEVAPVATSEVDIGVGDRIRAKYKGSEVTGLIVREFPDEMELLIRVGDEKLIIPAGDVIAKL